MPSTAPPHDDGFVLAPDHPGELHLFQMPRSALYKKVIFPLLQKVGIHCHKISYRYKTTIIGTEDDVQKWLCQKGIPNQAALADKDDELQLLRLWAAYAHVIPSALKTGVYREYDTEEIVQLLVNKLKVKSLPDTTFTFEANASSLFRGSLEDLRVLLRAEGLSALGRRASRGRTLTPEDRANLQVWAARSTRPLPIYLETEEESKKEQQQQVEEPEDTEMPLVDSRRPSVEAASLEETTRLPQLPENEITLMEVAEEKAAATALNVSETPVETPLEDAILPPPPLPAEQKTLSNQNTDEKKTEIQAFASVDDTSRHTQPPAATTAPGENTVGGNVKQQEKPQEQKPLQFGLTFPETKTPIVEEPEEGGQESSLDHVETTLVEEEDRFLQLPNDSESHAMNEMILPDDDKALLSVCENPNVPLQAPDNTTVGMENTNKEDKESQLPPALPTTEHAPVEAILPKEVVDEAVTKTTKETQVEQTPVNSSLPTPPDVSSLPEKEAEMTETMVVAKDDSLQPALSCANSPDELPFPESANLAQLPSAEEELPAMEMTGGKADKEDATLFFNAQGNPVDGEEEEETDVIGLPEHAEMMLKEKANEDNTSMLSRSREKAERILVSEETKISAMQAETMLEVRNVENPSLEEVEPTMTNPPDACDTHPSPEHRMPETNAEEGVPARTEGTEAVQGETVLVGEASFYHLPEPSAACAKEKFESPVKVSSLDEASKPQKPEPWLVTAEEPIMEGKQPIESIHDSLAIPVKPSSDQDTCSARVAVAGEKEISEPAGIKRQASSSDSEEPPVKKRRKSKSLTSQLISWFTVRKFFSK